MICKWTSRHRREWWYCSFILTMWYVNYKYITAFFCAAVSFILTMWYVNHTIYRMFTALQNVFYINYVICKFVRQVWFQINYYEFYINYVICKYQLLLLVLRQVATRFILTMWYVNKLVISTPPITSNSFILTMWYVNYVAKLHINDYYEFYINYVICK